MLEAQNLRGDLAEHRASPSMVLEHVHAEACEAGGRVGEVGVVAFLVLLAMAIREHGLQQLIGLILADDGAVRDLVHVAIDAPTWFVPSGEMQIRGPFGHHCLQ